MPKLVHVAMAVDMSLDSVTVTHNLKKQIGTKYTATWPLRHATLSLPDNYRLSQNEAFSLVKCIRRYLYCRMYKSGLVEWAGDHFGLG